MSSDEHLVSITVAAYNAASYLGEMLDSALSQTYPEIELVLVDDGSDDGTDTIAQSYGDQVRYARRERSGIGAARNHAVAISTGELLSFVDADDRLLPNAIEVAVAELRDHPGVEAAFFGVREFLSPDVDEATRSKLRPPNAFVAGRLPNAMLIRRAAFFRVGAFDESLRRGVTVDWLARAMEHDLQFVMLPEVLLERRLHAQNQGLREKTAQTDYARVLKAALDRRRQA